MKGWNSRLTMKRELIVPILTSAHRAQEAASLLCAQPVRRRPALWGNGAAGGFGAPEPEPPPEAPTRLAQPSRDWHARSLGDRLMIWRPEGFGCVRADRHRAGVPYGQEARRGAAGGLPVPGPPARHHLASFLIASGADVNVVQARVRHASAKAKTTHDTYGHLWPDPVRRGCCLGGPGRFCGLCADSGRDALMFYQVSAPVRVSNRNTARTRAGVGGGGSGPARSRAYS
jgi:hypothetical protein